MSDFEQFMLSYRFDFVAPSTFFEEKQPWMDKLQVLQKLAADEKNSARIFKALADPPTTSLQRLKALTTGGLPTFIDVGNSFGAPAIVEDNIMHQLVKNGKRVVMMGDDTWTQLYPEHFNKSFPYPSFNVKDLDTVDNGVIEHLLPSLHENDWDVLIAHFLGVDVINTLKSLSTPGGPHENTLLLVMGDHGQTLNGDHGGGTAEEVETSLFAWSPKTPPDAVLSVLGENSCNFDLHGKEVCVSTMQQLDFAVTVSALLGIPFPFGSIGRVNPELYALSAGTWDNQRTGINACTPQDDLEAWKMRYAEALCVNSWQVKRYIDQYSGSSIIGFSAEYLHHVEELYSKAQANWSEVLKSTCPSETAKGEEFKESASSSLQLQIDAYSSFLESFAKLARSAWTEFDLWLMGTGLLLMILSVITQAYILWQKVELQTFFWPRVALPEFIFLLLNIFARFGIELGMSKQVAGPTATKDHPLFKKLEEVWLLALFMPLEPNYLDVVGKAGCFCSVNLHHWRIHFRCTFDGLRYGAAFIGFDNFHIIRQGFLLSIDTFGVSHILPVLSLPFIAVHCYNTASKKSKVKDVTINILIQVHLMYGLITAITTAVTIVCVTIQRRHLMVWGLFAPKYVFDAIGLLLTDLLICLASLYYS
ncbi:GPI ethanolamine phosphate transferase 3 [Triticum urartu]|uniref:GPI ethanolamine phosphate transferase 3 n=1 Tax=Triticum urartu TaxID=4572 RepID=M8A687_TRIUA|nr:GPI ethanolamine phosphate transferase 3 [Triticum urartu]